MSRVVALVITAALSVAGLAQARPASHVINAKVSIEQHGTTRDSRPPDGDVGDIFTTTLLMNNTAEAFGKPKGASVGSMLFRYVIHGTCSTETCNGATADIVATSRLPGGTIVASENGIKLGRPPLVIPITKGTGTYRGAKGSITIGAASSPFNTFQIVLP